MERRRGAGVEAGAALSPAGDRLCAKCTKVHPAGNGSFQTVHRIQWDLPVRTAHNLKTNKHSKRMND